MSLLQVLPDFVESCISFGIISRSNIVPTYPNAAYKTIFDDFVNLFFECSGFNIDKMFLIGSRAEGLADVSSDVEIFVSFGEYYFVFANKYRQY